ncbi:metallophosphoesterase [Proteiniborus sp. MB09-C3]|uniref:metallophosphoesterase n=1 Tax=Proteiniborus sp. MB09-C3 TaxID=3050072 RepID=UPI0025535F17|nr:metallophosphoesterase [Proteiniborus sp. MB09-C3]WIV11882.1 metallophosphoesterase [Proteiniborus sp. MB09-C3]
MKIAVISDTHGHVQDSINALNKIDGIDLIIHLGDYSKDVKDIKEAFDTTIINVKGNCDHYDFDTPDDNIIEIKGKKIFMSHGDLYRVKHGLNDIYYKAKELNADVALFGHSHTSTLIEHDGILFLNPGSPTLPRAGTSKSIGMLYVDDNNVRGEIVTI